MPSRSGTGAVTISLSARSRTAEPVCSAWPTSEYRKSLAKASTPIAMARPIGERSRILADLSLRRCDVDHNVGRRGDGSVIGVSPHDVLSGETETRGRDGSPLGDRRSLRCERDVRAHGPSEHDPIDTQE